MRTMAHVLTAAGIVVGLAAPAVSAEYMEKNQQMASRSYSPGVISDGGRIVWLAGQTGFRDEQGKEVVGFEAQSRQAFRAIDAVLKKAGGSLANMVTMTVFIGDGRYGERFVNVRKENVSRRQLSGERVDHGVRLCGAGHDAGDSGRRGNRRQMLQGQSLRAAIVTGFQLTRE